MEDILSSNELNDNIQPPKIVLIEKDIIDSNVEKYDTLNQITPPANNICIKENKPKSKQTTLLEDELEDQYQQQEPISENNDEDRDIISSEIINLDNHQLNDRSDLLNIKASWREKKQEETFIRWINSYLRKWNPNLEPKLGSSMEVINLADDLKDGLRLLVLVQVLSGCKEVLKFNKKPILRTQMLENVCIALAFLRLEENVKTVNIDSSDVVDGNIKLILGLIWTLITHFNFKSNEWSSNKSDDALQENKESTTSAKKKLIDWLSKRLNEEVSNFTTEWCDGIRLKKLVESFTTGLFEDNIPPENLVDSTLAIAFRYLNVSPLVEGIDIVMATCDETSMMTYLSQFPNARPSSFIRSKDIDNNLPIHIGHRINFSIHKFIFDCDESSQVTATVTSPNSSSPQQIIFDHVTEGVQHFCITPHQAGLFQVRAYIGEAEVRFSPLVVEVVDDFRVEEVKVSKVVKDVDDDNKSIAYKIMIGHGNAALLTYFIDGPEPLIASSLVKQDNFYVIEYLPRTDGIFKLSIFYDKQLVDGAPFQDQYTMPKLTIFKDQKEIKPLFNSGNEEDIMKVLMQIRAYGDGLHTGCVGHPAAFQIDVLGEIEKGLSVTVDGPAEVFMSFSETSIGYHVSYTTIKAGVYFVSVRYDGRFHAPGSPFIAIFEEVTRLYEISIYTGDKLGAGTDANVMVTLCGLIGDTGRIFLRNSRNHLNKFERNQMDSFLITADNIGEFSKLRIGHDNSGIAGQSWYLDYVIVYSETLREKWLFPAEVWLEKEHLEVELTPIRVHPETLEPILYLQQNQKQYFGNKPGEYSDLYPNESVVSCSINDIKPTNKDLTNPSKLNPPQSETNHVDPINTNINNSDKDISDDRTINDNIFSISQINESDLKNKIEEINLSSSDNNAKIIFQEDDLKVGQKISIRNLENNLIPNENTQNEDQKINILNHHNEPDLCLETKKNEICQVLPKSVTVYDEKSCLVTPESMILQEIKLNNCDNDKYKNTNQVPLKNENIYNENVNDVTPEIMILQEINKNNNENNLEQNNLKLDNNVDESKKIVPVKMCKEDKENDNETVDNKPNNINQLQIKNEIDIVSQDKLLEQDKDAILPPEQEDSESLYDTNELEISNNDDISVNKDNDTNQKKRKPRKVHIPIEMTLPKCVYLIYVKTGDKLFAGTDGRVFITLIGEKFDSGRVLLEKSMTFTNMFERNHLDKFQVECPDVGRALRIRVEHDDTSFFASSWYLEFVEVEHVLLRQKSYFYYDRWIKKEAKKKCIIEISQSNNPEESDEILVDANISAAGPGLQQPKAGVATEFTVDVNKSEDLNQLLLVHISNPRDLELSNLTVYEGQGRYLVTFTPIDKGIHRISIRWGVKHAVGSPFLVDVT